MYEMTTKERMTRIFEHRDADRVPIIDNPWETTIDRWQKEGMPANTSFVDYFNLDRISHVYASNSPLYEPKIVEETDEYKIYTTDWGATLKNWKHITSTPDFLDFTIKDWNSWKEAKLRMTPDSSRIPWESLKKNYKQWRENGDWLQADMNFGFDVTHSWIVGTERLLMALVEDPDWCVDIFEHQVNVNLQLLDQIWDAGYEFDSIFWCDDMGYKKNQFFSVNMYRELVKPFHKKAIDWAHKRGVKAHLHSCGDINPIVPELVDIGLDALNPLEVKAGMNPAELKKKFGDKLVFHGGINAVLWDDIEAIEAEIKATLPIMKEAGGYIFSSDHSIPDTVSFDGMKRIIELVKDLGRY